MLAALVSLAGTSWNDANFVSFGGAGALVPHKTVHMLGEDINITIYDDKVHVRVYFSFENNGQATTVQMAFPFEYVNYGEAQVKKFASKVDGAPAETRITKIKRMDMTDAEWLDNVESFAYVKTIEFGEGQKRTVLVDYTTGHGYAGSGWQIDKYILKTGATWAGKIGVATITVDWTPAKKISRPDLNFLRQDWTEQEAEWQFITKTKATTTLTNFEPDFNLHLTTVTGWWDVWVNGKRMPSGRAISDSTGPDLVGDPRDPLYYYQGLGNLLEEWATSRGFTKRDGWTYPQVVQRVATPGTLFCYDGKQLVVKRGLKTYDGRPWSGAAENSYVYLKDLVEAIGGKFKWNPVAERIEIEIEGMPRLKG